MELTQEQRDIIKHSLGIDGVQRSKKAYRNRYYDQSMSPKMVALCELGAMERGDTGTGGMSYFHVTEAGAKAIGAKLPE